MYAQRTSNSTALCVSLAFWALFISSTAAFGAGNIASISKIEGRNWRHGDIEDLLKTLAFLKGHKWTSMMIKRVYFGNWLRDYSQALDVGTLKGVQSGTIRILVWILSFLSFGYATAEFEVTEERLGVYRPEEHIDNPKDYADNVDARKFDSRLRPPVQPIELQIDPDTGMKNYIANERLPIATSSGYVKFSFSRSIHFGRVYTSGASGSSGKEADLCEALRCLGQGLHCLEDFGAHSNYTELALREQGFHGVFTHTGTATEMNLRGHRVFPLVTGTFGVVDFLHSVLGEATDHFAQTEIDQMNIALGDAQTQSKSSDRNRGPVASQLSNLTSLLSQFPGAGGLCQEAEHLQAQSEAQAHLVSGSRDAQNAPTYGAPEVNTAFDAPPGSVGGPPGPGVPGMSPSFDPIKIAAQIYPILEFRDKVVRVISATIEKIPGLEALVEKITETLTVFILSLLAPFVRPIINAVSKQLKNGSSGVINASGQHQYEPWTDPHCSDPTHSLLSKDHFSNILNEPAGHVAGCILKYVAPRIIYAWQHPDIPVEQVLNDVIRVFHHPTIRDPHCELHRNMFETVQQWARSYRGTDLNEILGTDSVRKGKNHIAGQDENQGGLAGMSSFIGSYKPSNVNTAPWDKLYKLKNAAGLSRGDVDSGEDSGGNMQTALPSAVSSLEPPDPQSGYLTHQGQQYNQQSFYPPQGPSYSPQPSTQGWHPAYPPAQAHDLYAHAPGYPAQQHGGYPPPGEEYPEASQAYAPQQSGYQYEDPSRPPPPQQHYGAPSSGQGSYL